MPIAGQGILSHASLQRKAFEGNGAMGMLIDGVWTDEDLRNTDKGGAFQREKRIYRD